MRDFVTDRPDKTVNPVTVDAGHIQLEIDMFSVTFDRRIPPSRDPVTRPIDSGTGGFTRSQPATAGAKDDYLVALTNLRIGLLNNLDLHLLIRPLQWLRADGLTRSTAFGIGDSRVLLKYNLWGNEGGKTAAGLTFYGDVPTGGEGLSTRAYEGGATFAWLSRAPKKTLIGFEVGGEMRRDAGRPGRHLEIPASVSFSRGFSKRLSGKIELASVVAVQRPVIWYSVVALALLLSVGPNTQLDAGINLGLSASANDFNPFLGVSQRF